MDLSQLWTIVWSAVGIIVTGLATWLTTVVTTYFNKKAKNNKAMKWAGDIAQITMNAVTCVFQSFVETMKKSGKWNEETAREAKEQAYVIITTQLTPELKQYIEENFGDMKEYIMTLIESTIYQLKR